MIVDSHAHLNHAGAFDQDRAAVLDRARQRGVAGILNLATSPADATGVVATARDHPGVWAAVGIHPHEAGLARPAALAALEALAAAPEVVAWGEIGLDYHYLHAPRLAQQEALAAQLTLAGGRSLPVSVHTREADADTVELLRRHAGPPRGVIHCFTGGWELARSCLDLGFYLSFSGIVTFRNAGPLRQVAAKVPADRLLVETDSPYLAPAPARGGRNEPGRVVDVLACLAEVRNTSVAELAAVTTANFQRLFAVQVRTMGRDGPPSAPPG